MKIETKYTLGNEVWVLEQCTKANRCSKCKKQVGYTNEWKPELHKITHITVYVRPGYHKTFQYTAGWCYTENEIYNTKQEAQKAANKRNKGYGCEG